MAELDQDLRALQEVRDAVGRAKRALDAVARYTQEEIDRVCVAVVEDAAAVANDLARLAVEETGIGRHHYKILKTVFGCETIWDAIKDEKTAGIVSRDDAAGIIEVATPVGVVAAIIPTTNPTSTALHNALISLKGRNAVVLSPHPRARGTIAKTVDVMRRAIARVGGPPDLVQSLSNPTIESTGALMKHRDVSVILATGGTGLVKAAYSSGKPAYGVGPGNVPVYVDRSADVEAAARWIVASQSFDNGTFCCSEQALVVDRPIAERLFAEFARRGAHMCSAAEVSLLEKGAVDRGHMRPEVVGLDPHRVAELCGFRVPTNTTLLLAPQGGVGPGYPLSIEILCPLLSVHMVDGWEEGCEVSLATLRSDGLGHTIGLWATDRVVLDAWVLEKPANRIIVNGPTSEGAVGYSTNLEPSVSLGCGPQAGNITSDNITARHLVNRKRVAFPRRDWEELYAKNHARAAALSGDAAPRGSGLPGDPGLVGRGTPATPGPVSIASNWQGNPAHHVPGVEVASSPSRPAPAPPAVAHVASVVPRAPAAKPRAAAPRFTDPAPPVARPSSPAPGTEARPAIASAPAPARRRTGPYVGTALSTSEIQGILEHAGAGCPLGPCTGCPHSDVKSGACTA